ncbi:MAG: hypothetical protein JWM68_2887 [Verrucomicrobiales bacterium]|nr:hypothetical protein [Verrucomicrobiales bacterium]
MLGIPESLTFAGAAAAAALIHQGTLDLGQNTNAKILADRVALINSRNTYEEAKLTLAERQALVDSIMGVGREFITNGRDNLKPHLGYQYSKTWDVTGMVGSIAVPDQLVFLHPMLDSYNAYYGAHRAHEVASLNLTAARADELSTQLMTALTAVNEQETEVSRLKRIRDVKAEKLLRRLRGLRDELGQVLDPLDTLWMAFGFNMPGADQTPESPANVSAVVIGPGTAALRWDAAARAEYYRVWKRVIGVDAEPVAVGSRADIDFNLENLPAASTIEIYVSAVNNGGESQLSEKITITTH